MASKTDFSCFPESLLQQPPPGPADRRWIALFTLSRQEKALGRDLAALNLPFYLPLVRKTVVRKRRRIQTAIPLFSGYVFQFGDEEERVRALRTNRVAKTLDVPDQDALYHDLRQLQQLIDSDVPFTVEDQLSPGKRVRVTEGALLGIEGTVIAKKTGDQLLVAVNFLQKGVALCISEDSLQPVD